jgi:hypothetical protein
MRGRFPIAAAVLLAGLPGQTSAAGGLRPETVAGWDTYVRVTEARIALEIGVDRGRMPTEEINVAKELSRSADGRAIEAPGAMVHHWRGRVFVPRVSVDDVIAHVANPGDEGADQEDVVAARVLERGPGSLRLFLRLRRTQIVTVVYNSEHDVRYGRRPDGSAWSRSSAIRIVEIAEPDTPREWERPPGDDRGFLWRLNSYWRYEAAPGGVVVDCESISLSRSAPALVLGAVQPVIDQVARRSMERTLLAMRARFARAIQGVEQ